MLLVSELVNNAVVHGEGEPTVEIQRAGHGLRIGVHDSRLTIPPQREHLNVLQLPQRSSKILWFEIHPSNGL